MHYKTNTKKNVRLETNKKFFKKKNTYEVFMKIPA